MKNSPVAQSSEFLLRCTRACLYLLFLTPLLFWSGLIFPHNSAKAYFILIISQILFASFLLLVWRSPQSRPRFTTTDRLVLLFVATLILASIFGIDPLHSFWGSLDRMTGTLLWLHLTGVYIVARSLMRTQEDWHRLFSFSTCIAILIAFLHFLSLGGTELLPLARGGATFGNSSFLGGYLLTSFFLALFVASTTKEKQKRWFWLCAGALLLLTTFMTYAIAAKLSALGGMMLLPSLWLLFQHKRSQQILGGSIILVLISLFAISIVLLFDEGSFVREQFIRSSSGARFVLWDMAWQGIKERPFLGWGLENFGSVALTYHHPCLGTPDCGGEMWFDRAHNKLLDVAVESGLIGLSIYVSIFLSAGIALWKNRRAHASVWPSITIATALCVYFVQNLTILDTPTSLMFWLLLVAFASTQANQRGTTRIQRKNTVQPIAKRAITVALCAWLPVTLFFFVIQPLRGNAALVRLRIDTDIAKRLNDYRLATTLSPLGIDMRRVFAAYETKKELWLVPKETFENVDTYAWQELELARQGLQESLAHEANEIRTRLALGIIYQTIAHFMDASYFDDAEDVLRAAIARAPNHPQAKWLLISVYLDQGKAQEAFDLAQSVIDTGTTSLQAYYNRLLVVKWANDMELFDQLTQATIAMFPTLNEKIIALREQRLQSENDRQAFLTLFH